MSLWASKGVRVWGRGKEYEVVWWGVGIYVGYESLGQMDGRYEEIGGMREKGIREISCSPLYY